MKFTKTKTKEFIITSLGYLTLVLIISASLDLAVYKYTLWNLEMSRKFFNVEVYAMTEVKVPHVVKVKEDVKKVDIKEWVLNEFEKNGINPRVAECVIKGESGFNPEIMSPSREDFGIMQWHIQHIKSGFIKPSCAFSSECAVKKAIWKVKKDKSWGAWMSYVNNNCGRFGNTFIN